MATYDADGLLVDDEFFGWDQWGVWRTCPADPRHTWGDPYNDILARGSAPEDLTVPQNQADCPYCHPDGAARFWGFPGYVPAT